MNSKEYIVITNDKEKLVLTFTTLRQVATTVLFEVTDDRNEVFYLKKSLRFRYPTEILTMTITNITELESVQFYKIDDLHLFLQCYYNQNR